MTRFPSIFKFLPLFAFLPMLEATDIQNPTSQESHFSSFTGKVTKNKVRMRTTSNLDSPVVKELNKGEMLLVIGESEDFYAVLPPSDVKGYIFRTFVLDNKVEGNRVNIRLSPNIDAPVLAQMNSGDTVDGTISSLNNKWLEIAPPAGSKFYIAKEYIEKAGDKNFMAQVAKRKDEVNHLLQSNYSLTQQEFQKSFPDIQIERLTANYKKITQEYSDFPDHAARANELLEELHDNYLHKKVAFLETKLENQKYIETFKNQTPAQNTSIASTEPAGFPAVLTPSDDPHVRMAAWLPLENERFEEWSKTHEGTKDDFYADEGKHAIVLKGIIAPYTRSVKNKPGDFVILKNDTQLPQAFLYSTKVNLNDYLGREVTIQGLSRPNNHFAYPAYYIISIQ